jgi:Ca2+-binding EF-hand superfamily protein
MQGRLSKRRRKLVDMAFAVLDRDGSGQVELSDIAATYDVTLHPDFISGKRTKDQILRSVPCCR